MDQELEIAGTGYGKKESPGKGMKSKTRSFGYKQYNNKHRGIDEEAIHWGNKHSLDKEQC